MKHNYDAGAVEQSFLKALKERNVNPDAVGKVSYSRPVDDLGHEAPQKGIGGIS